jgi:hypothetical protein
MWIWWIISLVILVACAIFTYRMIVTSYEFLPADKRSFRAFYKEPETFEFNPPADSLRALKTRVQTFEDNTSFYEIQITKLQQRIKALEERNLEIPQSQKIAVQTKVEEEEDWKELFYTENEKKEKLENELDETKQELEKTETKLKEIQETLTRQKKPDQSEKMEATLGSITLLEKETADLKEQLAVAKEREKELYETRQILENTELKLKETQEALVQHQKQKQSEEMEAVLGSITLLEKETADLKEQLAVAKEREKELYETRQILEKTELKLKEAQDELSRQQKQEIPVNTLENENISISAMEKETANLKEQLEASMEREKELEQLLLSEVTVREKYAVLREEYENLKIETENLKNGLELAGGRDIEIENQQMHLQELEIKLASCEDERTRLKASLLRILESK